MEWFGYLLLLPALTAVFNAFVCFHKYDQWDTRRTELKIYECSKCGSIKIK